MFFLKKGDLWENDEMLHSGSEWQKIGELQKFMEHFPLFLRIAKKSLKTVIHSTQLNFTYKAL